MDVDGGQTWTVVVDLRWEHTTTGRQSAMLLRALRGHRETHFTILKYSFSLRPLRSADAGDMSVMTVDRTMLGTDMERLWESNS